MTTRLPEVRNARDARDAVTVGEAQRVVLPGARIAGGAAGLSRRLAWATSLRSRPPAFEPRGGGELVLAAREALEGLRQVDSSLTIVRVLEGLAQAGAAALALPPPVPDDAARLADELRFPLIEISETVSVLDTEREVIRLVLDRHNELQARASQFYRELAHLSVESQGLDAILRAAAAATGLVVTFEDGQFRVRTVAIPPGTAEPPLDSAVLSSVDERGRLAEAMRTQPLSSTTPTAVPVTAVRWKMGRYVAPVVTRERLRGFVSLCGPTERLTEFDQLATSRLAAICTIELAKEDAVLAAEQRGQRDLVDELLQPSGDVELARRRAAQTGISPDGVQAVIVLALEPGAGRGAEAALAEAVLRYLRHAAVPAAIRTDGTEVTVVCEVAGDASAADGRLRQTSDQVFAAASDEVGARSLSAGASRPHAGLAGLPQAASEAREALRIGRRVYGPGRLVPYAELGLYRVLHALRDTAELRSFYEQTLGPLVEYDRRTGQSLVETLEAFFACNGNLSQTAQRLHHHRNSLHYRIGRIQEIAGVDLEDPDTRLALQVALKARRLLA
ncbi:MAG: helix-turn-helix domain-containing protein [Chloroflexi bacterium]|nr:helix-turn-helix domain-containing protein [Chloroflexota bacterium]